MDDARGMEFSWQAQSSAEKIHSSVVEMRIERTGTVSLLSQHLFKFFGYRLLH